MNECGALVKKILTRKTTSGKIFLVSLSPPQIEHGLTWDSTQAAVVKSQ
jgi:hypothetical protein